jgi:hypothetical protein
MAKKKISRKLKVVENTAFKMRVVLNGTNPLVWRQIIVPADLTLNAFHSVLQLIMGWQMTHLFDFEIDGKRYAEPDDFDEKMPKSLHSILSDVLKDQKSFSYNYDFGDGWRHTIDVEEILPAQSQPVRPMCTGGENACPPEDCGGMPGFEDLKKILSNPNNPEYDERLSWLGGYYSPFSFDPNRINRDMLWLVDWTGEPNNQGLYIPFVVNDNLY